MHGLKGIALTHMVALGMALLYQDLLSLLICFEAVITAVLQ